MYIYRYPGAYLMDRNEKVWMSNTLELQLFLECCSDGICPLTPSETPMMQQINAQKKQTAAVVKNSLKLLAIILNIFE